MAKHANRLSENLSVVAAVRTSLRRLSAVIAALASAQAVAADSDQLSYRLTLLAASDWLYHGTTETLENPMLGINAEWDLGEGLFFGVEGHQAIENEERQRQRAALAYIGTTIELGSDWLVTPSASYRVFPGGAKDWDFAEYSLDVLSPGGIGIRVDYSPDYYDHRTRSIAVEVRYLRSIDDSRHYWFANAGSVELSNPVWRDHVYAQAGMGTSMGAFNLELTAHWNNQGDERSFGLEPYSAPGVVARIAYRIR